MLLDSFKVPGSEGLGIEERPGVCPRVCMCVRVRQGVKARGEGRTGLGDVCEVYQNPYEFL